MDKNKDVASVIVLIVAGFITAVVLVGFFILFWVKGVSELKLNEIGDSLAGPAGFLAFVWLLVTVILQRIEMTSLRTSAETQAGALETSARVSLMTHLRDLQEVYAADLRAIDADSKSGFLAILIKLGFLRYPEDVARKPIYAAWWLAQYFVDDNKYKCELNDDLVSVKAHHLKKHFSYDAYLALQDVLHTGNRVFKVLSLLREFARETGTQQSQKAFESALGVDWYESTYPTIMNIYKEASKVVAKGGIGNKVVTSWINGWLDEPGMETPWSDDWLSPK